MMQEVAKSTRAEFFVIKCVLDESELKERMKNRKKEITESEADFEVYLKVKEKFEAMEIEHIEIRTKNDTDVRPYVHDLRIEWKEITLPKDFSFTVQCLKTALSRRLKALKEIGAVDTASISMISLLWDAGIFICFRSIPSDSY